VPLKNKDRIQAIIAAREDPDFQGSLVDYLKKVREVLNEPKFTKFDERIYNNVDQRKYSTGRGMTRAIKNIILNKENDRAYNDPLADELWKYSLGGNDPFKYLEPSPYRPSQGDDPNSSYLRIKDLNTRKNILQELTEFSSLDLGTEEYRMNAVQVGSLPLGENIYTYDDEGHLTSSNTNRTSLALGKYTIGKGKDEKGTYISIYDKWDFKSKMANKFLDRKPEIYDRIYYKKNPEYIKYDIGKTRERITELEGLVYGDAGKELRRTNPDKRDQLGLELFTTKQKLYGKENIQQYDIIPEKSVNK